jgi:hypothetical protein
MNRKLKALMDHELYITVHQYVAIHTLSRDKYSHLSMPVICVQGSMYSSKGI